MHSFSVPVRTAIMTSAVILLAVLTARPDVDVINDRALLGAFTKGMIALQEEGTTVPMKTLKEQLDRKKTSVRLPSANRRGMSPDRIYSERKPGVLIVGRLYKCKKCTKWHTSAASGFALTKDGLFVTNYHVVDAEEENGALGVMTADGKIFAAAEVLAANKEDDVAIVRLADAELAPIPVRDEAPVGSPVAVISHPTSNFYTYTEGIISRYYVQGTGQTASVRMAITADYAKGSSGAPVLDGAGNVVGIASTTRSIYYNEEDGHQENLQAVIKACVPARAILDLIGE